MDNIIVITQNLKISSLSLVQALLSEGSETLVLSTQFIFDNEKEEIERILQSKCTFKDFSDLLSDEELEACDVDAYKPSVQKTVFDYYREIKAIKNSRVISKLQSLYPANNKIIVSDDLGLDIDLWLQAGYRRVVCEYYHTESETKLQQGLISKISNKISRIKNLLFKPIYEAYQQDGKRFLFYGSLNRISYRLSLDFHPASFIENIKLLFYNVGFVCNNSTTRLSTLHECFGVLPDDKRLNVKFIQDGYLPGNYSSKYLKFYGKNVEYYTWDALGNMTFLYHNLPHRILPFRKKLYLPMPKYPQKIKRVLCVASGAGDWTAIKNRSDEDKMIYVFGKIAAMFPEISFVYRCHPVWIHPQHQGVNSINRAAEYVHWLNLPNFRISSNIPNASENGAFRLSYNRSSFEEDLKDVDIVFGEHSISMIDAAFKNIVFASCNVTGRRDLFIGISQLGFPHCESITEIESIIKSVNTRSFKQNYDQAINNYNQMTDKE